MAGCAYRRSASLRKWRFLFFVRLVVSRARCKEASREQFCLSSLREAKRQSNPGLIERWIASLLARNDERRSRKKGIHSMRTQYPGGMRLTQWRRTPFRIRHRVAGARDQQCARPLALLRRPALPPRPLLPGSHECYWRRLEQVKRPRADAPARGGGAARQAALDRLHQRLGKAARGFDRRAHSRPPAICARPWTGLCANPRRSSTGISSTVALRLRNSGSTTSMICDGSARLKKIMAPRSPFIGAKYAASGLSGS